MRTSILGCVALALIVLGGFSSDAQAFNKEVATLTCAGPASNDPDMLVLQFSGTARVPIVVPGRDTCAEGLQLLLNSGLRMEHVNQEGTSYLFIGTIFRRPVGSTSTPIPGIR
jgi:hypothetical protein